MPGEMERLLQDQVRPLESRVRVSSPELPVKKDVVLHPFMNRRSAGRQAVVHIGQYRDRLVFYDDGFSHVFRDVRRLCRHSNYRLTCEDHLSRRHGIPVVRPGKIAGAGCGRAHWIDIRQHFLRSQHGDGAGDLKRCGDVYVGNIGMGVKTANEGRVTHPRQFDVVQEPALGLDQTGLARPEYVLFRMGHFHVLAGRVFYREADQESKVSFGFYSVNFAASEVKPGCEGRRSVRKQNVGCCVRGQVQMGMAFPGSVFHEPDVPGPQHPLGAVAGAYLHLT